ncbi:hypothetical protein KCP69_05790 [Salmonella enterica subsp. enterica]|nr:hypothetical protein KCP69_05790 [Salmonella enterica subsp. enterica]
MESLNALLQGMGLMHLGTERGRIMLLVSLLLLALAIAKKFERYCCCRLASAGCSPNIPEAGMALTLESLLAHHDAGQRR